MHKTAACKPQSEQNITAAPPPQKYVVDERVTATFSCLGLLNLLCIKNRDLPILCARRCNPVSWKTGLHQERPESLHPPDDGEPEQDTTHRDNVKLTVYCFRIQDAFLPETKARKGMCCSEECKPGSLTVTWRWNWSWTVQQGVCEFCLVNSRIHGSVSTEMFHFSCQMFHSSNFVLQNWHQYAGSGIVGQRLHWPRVGSHTQNEGGGNEREAGPKTSVSQRFIFYIRLQSENKSHSTPLLYVRRGMINFTSLQWKRVVSQRDIEVQRQDGQVSDGTSKHTLAQQNGRK